MSDELILVDIFDNEIKTAAKLAAHEKPHLHRAFSVFLYDSFDNKNHLLLQRRSAEKIHSAGLWANACCSHPRPGEELFAAAARRLGEELSIDCSTFIKINSFVYYHEFNNAMFEYEYDHILVGRYSGSYLANPREVAEVAWVATDYLADDLLRNPGNYAPWFLIAAPMVLAWLARNETLGTFQIR